MLDPARRAQSDEERVRLETIYREQAPRLSRFLRARFRGAEDCDDMVQDVFARLAGGRSLVELRNPEAYLKRILRNFLIDRKRRLDTRPQFIDIDQAELSVRAEQGDGLEVAQMQQRYRALVDQLPPRTRQVFLLHRAEGKSVRDIGAHLEISTRTVEWHISEAIGRIARELDRE
ncbi:RNA polymerase sigma factor [Sphingomonas sp. MMS12-HWE2-04]|uniref:RNA polymerase sigma factor n=1 Tax=Sphingomonas sp. MMS12-HWE2-04 TaxID=3234199 RepID=UPI0038515849